MWHHIVLQLAEYVLVARGDVVGAGPLARGDSFVQIALQLLLQGKYERDHNDGHDVRMELHGDLPYHTLSPAGPEHADDILTGGEDVVDDVPLFLTFELPLWILE